MIFIWEEFHSECLCHYSACWLWKSYLKLLPRPPGDIELTAAALLHLDKAGISYFTDLLWSWVHNNSNKNKINNNSNSNKSAQTPYHSSPRVMPTVFIYIRQNPVIANVPVPVNQPWRIWVNKLNRSKLRYDHNQARLNFVYVTWTTLYSPLPCCSNLIGNPPHRGK